MDRQTIIINSQHAGVLAIYRIHHRLLCSMTTITLKSCLIDLSKVSLSLKHAMSPLRTYRFISASHFCFLMEQIKWMHLPVCTVGQQIEYKHISIRTHLLNMHVFILWHIWVISTCIGSRFRLPMWLSIRSQGSVQLPLAKYRADPTHNDQISTWSETLSSANPGDFTLLV